MSSKKYGLGVIVGRFQMIHLGHAEIISRSLELCDTVGILVGSSQESRTMKNPFTYEERKGMLLKAFPQLSVYPLPDIGVGNCNAWGDYVEEKTHECFGRAADVYISGEEDRRESWFKSDVNEIYISKSVDISATQMKKYIINDDKASFEKYIESSLKNEFGNMREIILSCIDKNETKSI